MNSQLASHQREPTPLHELMSRLLGEESPLSLRQSRLWPIAGTLKSLSQALEKHPILDFINFNLRGIGQVIFVNNPISGILILAALFLQSSWIGLMSVLGVLASTVMALLLQLDRDTIRNGIFGYNGLLVGAALGTFGAVNQAVHAWGWAFLVLLFSALTTVLMKTFGLWWVKTFRTPLLTLPFNIATLLCMALVSGVPQPWVSLAVFPPVETTTRVLDGLRLMTALPIGLSQVFLVNQLMAGILIWVAVAICTPLGAIVGLVGSAFGLLMGLGVGVVPETLYAGLWGYNAVLSAMAIAGVFYAPNLRSVVIGMFCASLSAFVGGLLGLLLGPFGLPVLTLPFCLVTIGTFMVLQRSLPSLVPVALHTVTSPEEHQQRYRVAREVILNFRHQLQAALSGQRHCYLFERSSHRIQGDLRYLFNAIDTDRSGSLSTQELAIHLCQAGQITSEDELAYLFSCMDADASGKIDFEEFCELMLRHRRLIANYEEFVTYFLPIDANGDDAIGLDEINVAIASVGEPPLSHPELMYLARHMGGKPLSWNHFVEMLLVI